MENMEDDNAQPKRLSIANRFSEFRKRLEIPPRRLDGPLRKLDFPPRRLDALPNRPDKPPNRLNQIIQENARRFNNVFRREENHRPDGRAPIDMKRRQAPPQNENPLSKFRD